MVGDFGSSERLLVNDSDLPVLRANLFLRFLLLLLLVFDFCPCSDSVSFFLQFLGDELDPTAVELSLIDSAFMVLERPR